VASLPPPTALPTRADHCYYYYRKRGRRRRLRERNQQAFRVKINKKRWWEEEIEGGEERARAAVGTTRTFAALWVGGKEGLKNRRTSDSIGFKKKSVEFGKIW
jgi:hypothetical protein